MQQRKPSSWRLRGSLAAREASQTASNSTCAQAAEYHLTSITVVAKERLRSQRLSSTLSSTTFTRIFGCSSLRALACSRCGSRKQSPAASSANLTASRSNPHVSENDATKKNDKADFPPKPASFLSGRLHRRRFRSSQIILPQVGSARWPDGPPQSGIVHGFCLIPVSGVGGAVDEGKTGGKIENSGTTRCDMVRGWDDFGETHRIGQTSAASACALDELCELLCARTKIAHACVR